MLTSGTQLGPYDVVEPLGAGGMGEVYRARDPRLGREIALKVLPREHASDPERLRRFEREARAVASLNHPHILAVYDIGTEDSTTYVAFELLEGQTLRTVLLEHGGLPPRKVVDYGVQMCRGLAAAHERGIVHRDLKPENLFLTRDGQIKILDFGLARVSETPEEPDSHDSQSPTATEPGLIVGTASYMSPEQARGRPADARSDLFALGAVLYEMLSGRRAFSGETAADTLSAILHHDPPDLPVRADSAGPGLERVVRRCLEKRPEDRFDSAHDLGLALEMLSGLARPAPGPGQLRRSRRWVAVGLAAVVLALGGWFLWSRATESPTQSIEITPFTSEGGEKDAPQLSPDGEKVAYSWAGPSDDNWDIYVKGMGPGATPLRVTESPAHDRSPVWSPDGRQIAFVRDLEGGPAIYSVPWPSGPERRLIQLTGPSTVFWSDSYFVTTLAWSPDGDWLAYAKKPSEDEPARIFRLALATREERALTSPPRDTAGDFYPNLSPDGSQLAFVRSTARGFGSQDVWVQAVDSREARQLTFERYGMIGAPAWTPDGSDILFTVFLPRPTILRASLAGGEPQAVLGVGEDAGLPSIVGSRMVYGQYTGYSDDTWRTPGRGASAPDRQPEKLIVSSANDHHPAYSPDGRRLAFSSDRSGAFNVWVCDNDGRHPVQLTDYESHTGTPRWSPDGRRIVFDSYEAGDWNLYIVDAEGGASRQLTQDPSAEFVGTWSHDGRWIFFSSDRTGESQIWKIRAAGGPAVQVTRGGGYYAAQWCDGSYLYYTKSLAASGIWRVPVGGGEEIEVFPGPVGGKSWALSRDGIYFYTWSVQGRLREYVVRHLDLETTRVTELFRRRGPMVFASVLAVSPDQRWILHSETPLRTSELMLVENFR